MKLPPTIPNSAGVYALHNLTKDLYYIGSSKSVRQRISNHIHHFKHQTHNNRNMALDYLVDEFEFLLLEEVSDPSTLASKEHEWYLKYKSRSYNLGISGKSGPMKGPYRLTSPDGKIYEGVLSLPEFYQQHKSELCPSVFSLSKLVNGYAESIKGWTCKAEHTREGVFKNTSFGKNYYDREKYKQSYVSTAKNKLRVTNLATGEEFFVTNITKFCRDAGLSHSTLSGRMARHDSFFLEGYKIETLK